MKVLILDDEKSRHDGFNKIYQGEEIHHAYHVGEAIELMNKHQFDIAQLDFDLGSGCPTGLDAVEAIIAMDDWQRPRTVIVHSRGDEEPREMGRRLLQYVDKVRRSPYLAPKE